MAQDKEKSAPTLGPNPLQTPAPVVPDPRSGPAVAEPEKAEPPAPAPTPRTPDAIITPLGYAGPVSAVARQQRYQQEFAKILKCTRIYSRNQGDFAFHSGFPGDTLLFPKDHDRHPEERYDWEEQANGVKYGYLKQDPPEEARAEGT